ncbi:hypothetical protein HDV06_003739, partial [Boothiomyces sp. JEL0866]
MSNNKNVRWLGSASHGPGVLSMTFDWTLINVNGWQYSPFYTTINGAVVSQVLLWYSRDVYRQFREALAQKDSELDAQDPHYKIMKSYGDIKELHYLIFFLAST